MRTELLGEEVHTMLLKSGWEPGRRAANLLAKWDSGFFRQNAFFLSPAAREVLLELGGLSFEQDEPGETVARRGFCFDPTGAEGESDRFADFEDEIDARLCPVGEADDGDSYLAVAEDGCVLCLMDDGWIIGKSIEEALTSLVLGRQGEPV